jgi:hypothetical protein
MRWLAAVVVFLLALGTLRMVGCGDDGPECIYPFDRAAGTVRDPTCDDENECTEGNCDYGDRCSNLSWFRDGEPCDSGSVPDPCSIDICVDGRCERTEKPCEGDLHEDCAYLLNYDCDPDTGVVECIWDTHLQGRGCCIKSEYDCPQGFWSCGHYCTRVGYCIDRACVDGNGYPRDCTDRDDARPCEVGDTIGLCWKGDCAVLDCTGLSSGTLCWFYEYNRGECHEGDWQCFYAPAGTGGPPGWTCGAEYYGTADGCDCGCGVIDPDCADGTVASCDYCVLAGSCSWLRCPGDIDPTQNWHCGGWGGTGGSGGVGGA